MLFERCIIIFSEIINCDFSKRNNEKMFLYNIYIKVLYGISCYSVADPNNKLYSVYSDKYYKFISAIEDNIFYPF